MIRAKSLLISGVLLAIDRLTKIWMTKQSKVYLSQWFKLQLEKNFGWFYFQVNDQWLLVISLVIMVWLVWLIVQAEKKDQGSVNSLGLILLGGLSNFYDRLVFGYVVDWIWVAVYPWAVFNLADLMIVGGAGRLIIKLLKDKKN